MPPCAPSVSGALDAARDARRSGGTASPPASCGWSRSWPKGWATARSRSGCSCRAEPSPHTSSTCSRSSATPTVPGWRLTPRDARSHRPRRRQQLRQRSQQPEPADEAHGTFIRQAHPAGRRLRFVQANGDHHRRMVRARTDRAHRSFDRCADGGHGSRCEHMRHDRSRPSPSPSSCSSSPLRRPARTTRRRKRPAGRRCFAPRHRHRRRRLRTQRRRSRPWPAMSLSSDAAIPGVLLHVDAPEHGVDVSVAAGLDDRTTTNSLSPDAGVRIASITKTFVAASGPPARRAGIAPARRPDRQPLGARDGGGIARRRLSA